MASPAAVETPPAATPETAPEADSEWQSDPRLAPPSEPKAQTPEPPAPAPEPEAPAPAAKPTEAPEWKARLDAKDPDFIKELLSHPVIQGHTGTLADRLERDRASQREAEAKAALLDQEAQEHPDLLQSQERLSARQTEIETAARAQALTDAMAPMGAWVAETLPEPAVAEYNTIISTKPSMDLPTFTKTLIDLGVKHELAAAKAKWEKEELPARFKDYLAAKGEAEPSPDLGGGAAPSSGAGLLTLEKYQSMTPAEARKLKPADIDAMWARHNAAGAGA